MKKPAVILTSVLCLPWAAPSAWSAQRSHHPWFSHASRSAAEVAPMASTAEADSAPPIISREDVRVEPRPAAAGNDRRGRLVAQQALRYNGTRYKYGGTSKRGLDCSGLVSQVWSDLKMKKIPRVSSALYNSGQPVRLAELRPGDLVFFKNTYKRGISHVGVYAGSNKFVHAANHRKGVTITRLSDPYYQVHYAGARRLY